MASHPAPSQHASIVSLTSTIALAAGLVSVGILVYAGMREASAVLVVLAAITALGLIAHLSWRPRTAGLAPRDDAVTGLPTRATLGAELERRLATADGEQMLLLILDLHGFKEYNDNFGRAAGNALLKRLADKLTAATEPSGSVFRLTGDEFGVIAPVGEGDAERLIDETTAALTVEGEGFRVGCSFGGVLIPYEARDPHSALRLADERLTGLRRSKQHVDEVRALVEALSARQGAQPLHGRVESLSVAIGGLLGVHGDNLEALARAAELHDVGKLSIPSEILDKPGPLDDPEWEFVRQQTLVGERLLRTSPQLREVSTIVRATLESWDGSGYPDGLAGEAIPLAARIIRVCHAFDAMLSERAHRAALTPEQAHAEIHRHAGTVFDPAVVEVLASLVRAQVHAVDAA